MSIFDDAARNGGDSSDTDDAPDTRESHGTTASTDARSYRTQIRDATVSVEGDDMTIERPATKQPDENGGGNWFNAGSQKYGRARGIDAIKQRQLVQTSAMQSIVNGIVDQLLGGDLAFIDDEDAMDDLSESELEAADRLKTILRDVLTGPHMTDEDLDDIVTACVEDMLGPGNAYVQLLSPRSGDLPVVSLTTLDPLTIRHNVDEHGYPENPPYWQARSAFGGGEVMQMGDIDPVPLQKSDLAVLRYPKGNRSYRTYPVSAAWQIKEWLEILADSTTHHKRYYSDNEVPPGLLQVVDASSNTVENIKHKVEEASGDPRDFPIVGGEAPANWIEMGGTAINLDVIGEQQWFYELCLGSLGLGKAEVGMIEDVNRANGEVEAERVTKRVAGPFGNQFEEMFLHVARQFDAFTELGEPFTPTLARTDPRAEAAKRERLMNEYEAGKITLRQYVRRTEDEAMAEDDEMFTTTINGETVNYGDDPKWIVKRKLSALGATDPDGGDASDTDDGGEE